MRMVRRTHSQYILGAAKVMTLGDVFTTIGVKAETEQGMG